MSFWNLKERGKEHRLMGKRSMLCGECSFLLQFQWESGNGKIEQKTNKQTNFSLYPFGKIYVCPIGRLSQTLFTTVEPAAQLWGMRDGEKKPGAWQQNNSNTISVFSKLSQIRVFSQVQKLSHRDSAPTHRQEIDALSTGCLQCYTEANSVLKREKLNLFKILQLWFKRPLKPIIFKWTEILFNMRILFNYLSSMICRSLFFSTYLFSRI